MIYFAIDTDVWLHLATYGFEKRTSFRRTLLLDGYGRSHLPYIGADHQGMGQK